LIGKKPQIFFCWNFLSNMEWSLISGEVTRFLFHAFIWRNTILGLFFESSIYRSYKILKYVIKDLSASIFQTSHQARSSFCKCTPSRNFKIAWFCGRLEEAKGLQIELKFITSLKINHIECKVSKKDFYKSKFSTKMILSSSWSVCNWNFLCNFVLYYKKS